MTVQTDSARKSYAGDGSTVAFAFPYRFLVDADLKVYVRDAAGAETLKTITTDYTVTGAGAGAGGTVTFLVAPIVGETVVVIRDPDLLQEIDYSEGDAFPAETHESGLDKLTMVVQRLKDRQDRSFELGETDTQGSGQYDVGGNRLSNIGPGTADSDAATVAQFNAWVLQIAADATAAGTAKTNAETAQGLAETAKNDAENAKTAAETALDDFTDLYLGALASDPATDLDGDPLQAGAFYLRTADSVVRVYNGSVWNDIADLASLADGSITDLKISAVLDAGQKASFKARIGAGLPRFHFAGFGISNNSTDANNDIDFAIGECRDDADSEDIELTSALTKRLDANWVVGTNQGGLDTGSKAISTWYYPWAIKRTDTGVVDVLFSLSKTSPTMPASYDKKRRIRGAVLTDSAGNIWKTSYRSGQFLFDVGVTDIVTSSLGTTAVLYAITAPPDFDAILNLRLYHASTAGVLATSPYDADTTPVAVAFSHLSTASGSDSSRLECVRRVNASSQLRLRSTAASTNMLVNTLGFIDPGDN